MMLVRADERVAERFRDCVDSVNSVVLSAAKDPHLGQPLQYAGIPVPSTWTGIRPPGMRGRQLAATDSPNAARHSWGLYANPGTAYWYTRVLQWHLAVPASYLFAATSRAPVRL